MSTIITCGPTGDYSTITTALQAVSTAVGSTFFGKDEFIIELQKESVFDEVLKFPQIFGQLYQQQNWAGDWKVDAGFSATDRITIQGDQQYYTYEQERPKLQKSTLILSDLVGSRPFWTSPPYDSDIAALVYWPPAFTTFRNFDVGIDSMGSYSTRSLYLFRLNDKAMTLDRIKMDIQLSLSAELYYIGDSRLRGTDDLTVDNVYSMLQLIFRGTRNNQSIYCTNTVKPRRIYGFSAYRPTVGIYGSPSTSSLTIRNTQLYLDIVGQPWYLCDVSHSITNGAYSGTDINRVKTYYGKTLSEIGYTNPDSGVLQINRQCLSYSNGIKVPSIYTNDFVGNDIIYPSISPYYLFDIPNASAPKPSFVDGVYGSYASGVVLAYPCDGRRSLLLESKPLQYVANSGIYPNKVGLSQQPSMYGWVMYTPAYGLGVVRTNFTKLNGKKVCTIIVHSKLLANYNSTWTLCGDGTRSPEFPVTFGLSINTFTNTLVCVLGSCTVTGSYSGLVSSGKWNTHILRLNLSASTDAEKVNLFVGHRGLTRKLTNTVSGTIPSSIPNITKMVLGFMVGHHANFVIYDRYLSNNEIYNISYDPFIMYRNNIKRRMFIILKVIKSTGLKWFQQAGQMIGQMSGQAIKK